MLLSPNSKAIAKHKFNDSFLKYLSILIFIRSVSHCILLNVVPVLREFSQQHYLAFLHFFTCKQWRVLNTVKENQNKVINTCKVCAVCYIIEENGNPQKYREICRFSFVFFLQELFPLCISSMSWALKAQFLCTVCFLLVLTHCIELYLAQ